MDKKKRFSIPTYIEDEIRLKNKAIEEAGPQKCPLCNSAVRVFYVHYTAKILMCENLQCEYPFGDDVKIYESDDDGYFPGDLDMSSFTSKKNRQSSLQSTSQSQGTNSEVSTSDWSEIARINLTYDSDDSMPSNMFSKRSSRKHLERVKKQENEDKIKQNVEKIKELNKMLFDNVDDCDTIRNEKWIKNLSSMQSSSGKRLVKEQELQKLQKKQNVDIGEFKIDIESGKDSMSSIKIDLGNKGTAKGNNKKNIEV